MNVRIISYDLRKPGRDYSSLYGSIKFIGTAQCRPLESVWLVRTSLTNAEVRDRILSHLDASDGLLVGTMGSDWASLGIDPQAVQWLKQNA